LRSSIHRVYESPGFLVSSCLSHLITLQQAITSNSACFFTRATIVDVSNISTRLIHGQCNKVMEDLDGFYFCPTCQKFDDQANPEELFSVTLDDGTAQITTVPMFTLILSQIVLLYNSESFIGKTLNFAIIQFQDLFRIESVCLDPPIIRQSSSLF